MKGNMINAITSALGLELQSDPDMVVLGEDVGKNGGVFRVTDGLQAKYGENRVFDTPLAESAIVGTAIGMAVYGLHPVAEIQFSGFMYPAFDQLISHASRMRNRSRGAYSCPLVVRTPCSGGVKAPEHHSESMEAIFIHTPGLKVVMPSTPLDAKGLLTSAIRDPDPVIFFEPLKLYRSFKEDFPDESYSIPLGEAKVLQEGKDLTIVTWGTMTVPVKEAVEKVSQNEKYSIEVIDLRTLSPIDWKTVHASVEKTGRCLIVQEAPQTLGLASEVVSRIVEKNILSLKAPVLRVAGFDTIIPMLKMEDWYVPNANRVYSAVRKIMAF